MTVQCSYMYTATKRLKVGWNYLFFQVEFHNTFPAMYRMCRVNIWKFSKTDTYPPPHPKCPLGSPNLKKNVLLITLWFSGGYTLNYTSTLNCLFNHYRPDTPTYWTGRQVICYTVYSKYTIGFWPPTIFLKK